MEVRLPNIEGAEMNTLYIIGNGFDLFHDVRSKYKNFQGWLNCKDIEHEHFVEEMEELFPLSNRHGNLLWKDFEDALGKYDLGYIQKRFSGKESNPYFDEDYQRRAAQKMNDIVCKIPLYLREWLSNLDIKGMPEKLTLSPLGKYLTFNYTLLLEQVYRIPARQILHIHGDINNTESLITGHDKPYSMNGIDIKNCNTERSWENISIAVNSLVKPVEDNIQRHKNYFNSLSNIVNIIVFGHSLSRVDIPYFIEVIKKVSDNASWYFVVYDDSDIEKVQKFIRYTDKRFNEYIGEDRYRHKLKMENCNYCKIVNN